VPALPSLELLAGTVEAELAAQERPGDALDSKAGVLLGFAGVLVGLTVTRLEGDLATVGAACAGVAAVLAGVAFVPRSFPTLKLRPLRRRYRTADEEFTRLRLLDTRIAMQHETLRHLRVKAYLVTVASIALGAAVFLTVLAGTLGGHEQERSGDNTSPSAAGATHVRA
jgi:uncharacterized membrane protein